MTSDPSSPKLLKSFILIASLLSWQHISLWIKSNHGDITSWDSSLVPEEFWEEVSVIMFWVEGYAVIREPPTCTYGLRMPFLVLDPQALYSTHKCFLDPFSLLLWSLTITRQRLVQPLTLSVPLIALSWQIFNRKCLQTMYMTPYSPSLPNPLPQWQTLEQPHPENKWWCFFTSVSENGQRMYPCNWMYLILH